MNTESLQHKHFWQLLRPNFKTLIIFESLYAAAGGIIVVPLLYWLFRGALNLSGLEFLAPHTVGAFIQSPAFWVAAIIMLLIAAFYSVVSIGGVIYACEYSKQGKKIGLGALIKAAFGIAKPVIRPKNWGVILLVLVIIPLMNIGVTPAFLGAITVPDFILEFISYNKILITAAVIVEILLVVLILRWLYAFHYMALDQLSFKEARKKSAVLSKGHRIRDLLALILTQIVVMLITAAVIAVLTLLFSLLFRLARSVGGVIAAFSSVGMGAIGIFLIIAAVIMLTLGMPVCYATISARYYVYREQSGDPTPVPDIPDAQKKNRIGNIIAVIITVLLMIALSALAFIYSNGLVTADDVKQAIGTGATGVVAHRCGAHFAPENTVAALNKAADMGVDWCEIDVQQCKDGSIIVMHDTNFKRTTGLDADSWTVTLDEVKKLDAGSTFSKEYAGEPIPTLDEMIKAAKARNIKLQIEMKPTGNEHDFEKNVADIIAANDFINDCVIASQDYQCLEAAHQYNPAIRTLYIVWIAFGDVTKIEAATDFSVESTWVCDTLVKTVHDAGNRIFAWTVNTPSVMQRMINCGIDCLVTDEVPDAMQLTKENSGQSLAEYMIDFFDLPKKMNTEV